MMHTSRLLVLALFAAACAHQPSPTQQQPQEEQTRRYTVLMSTNKAGSQVVTTRGNETIVDFEFNDRGRGPKLHTVMRVDERGVPLSLAITGNDYYKAEVHEHLSTADRVTWKNTAESGEATPGAFYTSMYGPPEESAVLARALLKAGGRIPLHPGGEATIR
ncbi:MAG: hypothetical protein ACXWH7_10275, partial [Thermoanaerobaculia bacterium]